MAEEEENKETEEEQPKEKKSSNMLMIVIIIILILIILIGGVIAFLMMGDEKEVVQDEKKILSEKTVSKKRGSSKTVIDNSRPLSEIGVLYPLDTFTVNLKSDSGRRYLKVTMSLEIDGEELSLELDSKSAVLRDRIIRILTSKTLEEISSKKGKAKVTQQIVDSLNSIIVDGSIKDIYFTEFVIQ